MKQGDQVGFVCCSNGLKKEQASTIQNLKELFENRGIKPLFSNSIYEKAKETVQPLLTQPNAVHQKFSNSTNGHLSAKTWQIDPSPHKKAEDLLQFYQNDSVTAIFDLSGGDLANTILPYLDFEQISKAEKMIWGYSDLTVLLNAIYTQTGHKNILYQIRNLTGTKRQKQQENFFGAILEGKKDLFTFPYMFYQGSLMEGILLGGNIRCFLKLAGTPYFPDLQDKILFLEARSGTPERILSYYAQLAQLGVFQKVQGILLGTFTQMDQIYDQLEPARMLIPFLPSGMPLAITPSIGHGDDSLALEIGGYYVLRK